jgi:hypothetical protein
MKELVAAMLLAIAKQPVSLNHEDNIRRARQYIGDINVSDGETWHTIFTKEAVLAILDKEEPIKVGDTVRALYREETKEGTVRTIGYQIDGFGNKYYTEDEVKKV